MKEIKITQDDDGNVKIETMSTDGNPVTSEVESIEEALKQIKSEFGVSVEPELEEMADEVGKPIAATKGKTLEENLPVIDEEEKGMRPKKKPDWSKYATM